MPNEASNRSLAASPQESQAMGDSPAKKSATRAIGSVSRVETSGATKARLSREVS